MTDDEFEADLDVQLAGGVAPGATVKLVVSEDSLSIGAAGVDLSAIYIIDNNIAPILSESFGFCEPNITAANESFYDDLWQQASAEGITVVLPSATPAPLPAIKATTSPPPASPSAVSRLLPITSPWVAPIFAMDAVPSAFLERDQHQHHQRQRPRLHSRNHLERFLRIR